MMLDCWKAKPLARPTFTKLSQRIGTMLEDSVRKVSFNDRMIESNVKPYQTTNENV